ncbi:MAG: chlorite dismutase family protein [Gloeobacteraceae cyanobacterium ES-bin-144]|nr:chlorite dismutase family protein [Verrucomicrobiales bacterium]
MISNPRLFSFIGGNEGPWKSIGTRTIVGDSLAEIERLRIQEGHADPSSEDQWILHGATSNERYVTRPEKEQLLARQPALGRPDANCAVLIPILKSPEWWAMTQDERRGIFETHSHHTQIGMEYLPAIARKLHHCRDLTTSEPFDFLTWFEFAEKDTMAFDKLLERLRASIEWQYVEREVEVRLIRG